MAVSRSCCLLISMLLLVAALHQAEAGREPGPHPTDRFGCDYKCGKRCSRNWKHEMCLKMCDVCCNKCKGCVPDGPFARKDVCPCYKNLKNDEGEDKCP